MDELEICIKCCAIVKYISSNSKIFQDGSKSCYGL